jgi:hypothetical protein
MFVGCAAAGAELPLKVMSPRDRLKPTGPTLTRIVADVPEPARTPLSHEEVFPGGGLPDHEALRKHFLREGRLRREDTIQLIGMARDLFKAEPNLLELEAPLVGTPGSEIRG